MSLYDIQDGIYTLTQCGALVFKWQYFPVITAAYTTPHTKDISKAT